MKESSFCPICQEEVKEEEFLPFQISELENGSVVFFFCKNCNIELEASLEDDKIALRRKNIFGDKAFFAATNPFQEAGWPSLPVKDLTQKEAPSKDVEEKVFQVLSWLEVVGKEARGA